MLRVVGIPCIQGNYDNSVGNGLADCQCGYTDPRDNYFARLSYDYTFRHTSNENKAWLKSLPAVARIQIGPYRALLCHGSPRKTNEFLWESATSDAFLNWLFEKYEADIIVGTHTGLHWHRAPSPGKHFINCGAIGRPPNDGETTVVYAVVGIGRPDIPDEKCLDVEFIRLVYDHARLARDMDSERLPDEFIETIRTGWWTTCNEILPAKERARGIY
jgi:diadenosine tetraphosphatase ApaH/serine/threonine PP2A family protein phosphatase